MTDASATPSVLLKLHPRYLLWRLRGGRRLDYGVKSLPLPDRGKDSA